MRRSGPLAGQATSAAANIDKSVLVIEDNVLNMKLFSAMLSADGYVVLEAPDGSSGLAMAREKQPDLIVMDINLPGVSGLELRKILRTQDVTQYIPILVTTADPVIGVEEEIKASEYDGYMAKPMVISEFLALVDWLILRAHIAHATA